MNQMASVIVVTNLNPETRDNAIEFFFSNKRRSNGGPVVQVDRLNKSCAHVHFSSSLDAQQVVHKGSHVLDGFPLDVSFEQTSSSIRPSSQVDVDTRLTNDESYSLSADIKYDMGQRYETQYDRYQRYETKYRADHEQHKATDRDKAMCASSQFATSHNTLFSNRGDKEICMEVDDNDREYNQPVYSWDSKSGMKHEGLKFQEERLNRQAYPVQERSSKVLDDKMNAPEQSFNQRSLDKEEDVEDLLRRITNLQLPNDLTKGSNAQIKLQQADKTERVEGQMIIFKDEVISNLKPAQIKILSLPQVCQKFKEKWTSLTFEVDHRNLQMKLKAPENIVMSIKGDVLSFVTAVCERQISLTPAKAKMFSSTHAQDFIQAKLEKRGLACWWAVEHSDSLSMCSHMQDVREIQEILEHAFREETISLDDDKMAVVKSLAWQAFVKKVEHPERGTLPSPKLISNLSLKSVTVVDVVEDFARTYHDVKSFFNNNRLEEIKIKIDVDKQKFLKQFYKEELKELCKQKDVTLNLDKDGCVVVRGLHDNLSIISEEISQLMQSIKSEQKTFEGPGIVRYFSSQQGQDFLMNTGNIMGCLVTTSFDQTKTDHEKSGSGRRRHRPIGDNDSFATHDASSGDTSDAPIRIISGDLANSKADVIVSTAHPSLDLQKGVLSRSILQHGGDAIQQELQDYFQQYGSAQLGKLVESSGGNLHCRQIFHLSLPVWQKDRGQVLKSAVLECLDRAHEKKAKSISFPTLGTGKLGYPSHVVADIMYNTISKWFHSHSDSCLKDVQIIVFSKDRQSMEAFRKVDKGSTLHQALSGQEDRDHGGRHKSHSQSQSSYRGRTRWTSVDVKIWSKTQEAVDKMIERIDRHIKESQTTKNEKDKIICSFSAQQQAAVMDLQKKHEVAIELDTHHGVVRITGFERNVLEALSAVKDIKFDASKHRTVAVEMLAVRWQYQVSKDKYKDFDSEHVLEIEAAYKKKESAVVLTDKQGRRYKIVFNEKKEYFLDDKSAPPISVRRRDILEEKAQEIPLPRHWDPMKGNKVQLVTLKPSSGEYKRVLQHFGGQPVQKIERVQNPTLFQQYKVKKKELEIHNPPGTENEKRLWHGTDSRSVDSIITNGFNRSYCGKNGTAYGDGVYFATDANYSRGFASDGKMFQARVLVGQSSPGQAGLKMPPLKPSTNRPYDSLSGPGMFVLFHDSQAYPEYLLTL